jgi:hypothetical protein
MNERLPSVPEGEAGDAAATAEPVERAPSRSEAPTERPSAPDSVEEQAQDGEEREEKKKEKDLSFWEFLKRTYASADPRSLGLFRIALGTLLFVDLVRRIPDIEAHYANTGWLTNHYMLFRPMSSYLFSLYLAASTPGEVKVFFAVHLLVYLLFLIGYRTRLMHVLSLVMLVSINSRNIAVENGGYVVLTLLVTWSMFLPLGKRFSVDALRESFRARREGTELALNDRSAPALAVTPVVSLAVAALILQWTTIYYFNVVHKSGPEWKDGTAVYYFFQQDRMVTWWGGFIRDYVPMWGFKAMTWGALAIESMVTVLLVSPIASHKTRMVAWLLVCTLHLSIDSVVQLGPFSYAMMTMFFALIPAEFWQAAGEKVSRQRPEVTLEFNPKSTFALELCRWVKRLDSLEKVTFRANPDIKGLLVKRDGAEFTNAEALREVARSFPIPIFWRAVTRLFGNRLTLGLQKPKSASTYLGIEKLVGRAFARAALPPELGLAVPRAGRADRHDRVHEPGAGREPRHPEVAEARDPPEVDGGDRHLPAPVPRVEHVCAVAAQGRRPLGRRRRDQRRAALRPLDRAGARLRRPAEGRLPNEPDLGRLLAPLPRGAFQDVLERIPRVPPQPSQDHRPSGRRARGLRRVLGERVDPAAGGGEKAPGEEKAHLLR